MKIKYILLIIGLLGLIASVYGMYKDGDISNHLIGMVCGASLIWGFFEIRKKENNAKL